MGFLSWLGVGKTASTQQGNPADDRYFEPWSAPNASGMRINAETAMLCAAAWRCVTIWCDVISTLPMGMFQLHTDGVIDGGMDPVPNHPIHDILAIAPNHRQTPAEFWATMIFNAVLRGVAYAEIIPGQRGFVDRLEPIKPDRIQQPIEVLPDGTLRLKVRNPDGTTKILLQEEVFRISGLSGDGINPIRPVDVASEAIGLLMAADQYAARVFSNNLNLGGVLTHPGKLSKEGGERLIARLMQRFAGVGNAHRPMILQEGMKFEKAAMTAQEAQLLDARKAQVRDIANYFGGVPLHLLGIEDGTGRATAEEQALNFIKFGIRPMVERIEQSIRRDLIIAPRRYVVNIDIDGLERGNMATRGDFYSKALGSGGSPAWLTVNEIRGAEGWNKSDQAGSDKLAMGTNPVSQPGQSGKPPAGDGAGAVIPVEPPTLSLPAPAVEAIQSELDLDAPENPLVTEGKVIGRKEVAALRRLNIRHAGDREIFRKAVSAFYGGFASEVSKRLGVTKEEAKAWCKARADRIGGANDITAAIEALEDENDAAGAA